MIKRPDTKGQRIKRHNRVRGKISGTAERPRLSVFRSENHIYAQIIDDVAGNTLVSASTVEKSFEGNGSNIEAAKKIGAIVAERALQKGIEEVVFDRGGYIYHGRVQALAGCARARCKRIGASRVCSRSGYRGTRKCRRPPPARCPFHKCPGSGTGGLPCSGCHCRKDARQRGRNAHGKPREKSDVLRQR